MRNRSLRKSGIIIVIAILFYSCDGENACEDGFVQQYGPEGSTFCIPEFEEGLLNDFNLGSSYFHEKYGVIHLDNGTWRDQASQIILP